MIGRKTTKEELYDLIIIQNLSYEEIGRMLNITGAAVKKRAKRAGIELEQRRKINPKEHFNKKEPRKCLNCGKEIKSSKYCSNKCKIDYEFKEWVKAWKNGEIQGYKGKEGISNGIRKYLYLKYDNKCAQCGWNKVNPVSKKSPLEIHHIDGNRFNNEESNLILLCPNCHSLTPNYKNLNKGFGPKSRLKNDLDENTEEQ